EWIVNFVDKNELKIKSVAYDPAYANIIVQKLDGVFDLIETPQRWQVLTAPTRQFKYDILDKTTVHMSNPLLDRAIYNSITTDKNDLFFIDKGMNREKIDPVDALLNA